jgi:hypothetical protein
MKRLRHDCSTVRIRGLKLLFFGTETLKHYFDDRAVQAGGFHTTDITEFKRSAGVWRSMLRVREIFLQGLRARGRPRIVRQRIISGVVDTEKIQVSTACIRASTGRRSASTTAHALRRQMMKR